MLRAALARGNLGAVERRALKRLLRTVEEYPDAMPDEGRWFWLRLEEGNVSYTAYLHPERFEFRADGALPERVEWELRYRGSGLRDRTVGDVGAALEAMGLAARDPEVTLKVKA